jgi:hypothetical protein
MIGKNLQEWLMENKPKQGNKLQKRIQRNEIALYVRKVKIDDLDDVENYSINQY